MFALENSITDGAVREKKPFKVLFSMNVHQVANPEMSLEDARSYVFFFREGREKVTVYVGLHFLLSDRKFFYSHSANPFSEGQLADIEDDARRFSEDLGAVLDEVDFSKMSDSEKNDWIGNLGILSVRKKEEKKPQEPAPEEPAPGPEHAVQKSDARGALPQPVPGMPTAVASSYQSPVESSPETVQAGSMQPEERLPRIETEETPAAPARRTEQAEPRRPAGQGLSQRKTGSESIPAGQGRARERAAAPVPEQPRSPGELQKVQPRKDNRTTAGLISREKEALARLLASF